MRVKLFIPVLILLLLVPSMVNAATQDEIDNLTFLLRQFEFDGWDDGNFDDGLLLDAFPVIHTNAINVGDDILRSKVIWAMGETGLTGFVPLLIAELEFDATIGCFALGKISSIDAVDALVTMLPDEDMQVRAAAAWGLGNMLYTVDMDDAKQSAVDSLQAQLSVEEEDWVRSDMEAAVTLIETGIIDSPIFIDIEE